MQRHPNPDFGSAPRVNFLSLSTRARLLLLLAVAIWGISFVMIKALGLVQQRIAPGSGPVVQASSFLVIRFGLAALIMAAWRWRDLRNITRMEWNQGLVLGVLLGIAMLTQTAGLYGTSASISAFFTQTGVIIIPLIVAVRDRHWPRPLIFFACALVFTGAAILTLSDKNEVRIGWGEILTLLSAVFFSAHVVWLERPVYASNRPMIASMIMWGIAALVFALPFLCPFDGRIEAWRTMTSIDVWIFQAPLIGFCTILCYIIMLRWQRVLPAPEAGIIYSMESVIALLAALVMPGWFSALAHIDYANEIFTWRVVVGGGLIVAANLIIALKPRLPNLTV